MRFLRKSFKADTLWRFNGTSVAYHNCAKSAAPTKNEMTRMTWNCTKFATSWL
jgi:hypothetical protein